MTLKKQLNTIKENWLLAVLLLVVVFAIPNATNLMTGTVNSVRYAADSMETASLGKAAYYPSPSSDFAPEVQERVVIKTSNLQTEVKRGSFTQAEERLRSIITTSDAFLLNENVNKYGTGWDEYYYASYQIKIPTEKYSAVVAQLKEIGEVKSFNENAQDVTGRYMTLQEQLEAELTRLKRYQDMYDNAKDVKDKIDLSDRIFNQERTIKYLQQSIENIDKRVDYSEVYFTMTEERSGYANLALVKLSELVKALVSSFNSLLKLVVYALPWLVLYLLVKLVMRYIKK